MSRRWAELLLWGATMMLAVVATVGARSTLATRTESDPPVPPPPADTAPIDADSLDEAAVFVLEHDPFRFERRPSDVPYTPGIETAPPPSPLASPRPALVLTGLAGGPPWQGVLEGVPGADGSVVVREGQVVGVLRVVRVTKEHVVVEGADTTWTLRLRRTW